jgi:hypothetical protein
MGDNAPKQEQKPTIEYTAQAASPLVSGKVKLTIGETGFTVSALFDVVEIPFAEVNGIDFVDYAVTVETEGGDYTFTRMGEWAQRFYDALCETWGKAVLRALFVSDKPILTANGDYHFTENGETACGCAPIHIYENCVVALPPGGGARRVPLCFAAGMDKGDYELTLRLSTGARYTFAKLGYDTAPFADALEKQIRALREKSLATIKELDPSLTAAQASRLAKFMPEGAAVPIGQLETIAPSFAAAVEAKLTETRAADSYKAFKELCDPARIWVGFKKNDARTDGAGAAGGLPGMIGGVGAMLGGLTGNGDNPLAALSNLTGGAATLESENAPKPDPYLFWLIVPSRDNRYAAVEFAVLPGESAATFVYRTGGDFSLFAARLNRALEAINFKREVVRLTDEELRKPGNADYYMAAKRTASLQFIRTNFTGRVIHSSPEAWKRKLTELWSGKSAQSNEAQVKDETAKPKFCGQCGAAIANTKFCAGCGAKL